MTAKQVVPVTCPQCGAQFTAQIENIVDGQDPALKSALLQGELNLTQCPQCGFVSPLEMPILYYDLEEEIALVYVPGGLNVPEDEQQKMIGNLTNRLVDGLPAEQRKFYLLNPKRFLSMDSLIKAVLEADGITEEELQVQQEKIKILEQFLQTKSKNELKEKIKQYDDQLDRKFFEILTASIQMAQLEGQQAGVRAMLTIRDLAARWSSQGRKFLREIDEELGLAFVQSQEDLLEKLQETKNEDQFARLVASGHQLLDYSFFQNLTAQIDEALKANDKEKAASLEALRTKILDTKTAQEKELEAALEKANKLLTQILQSDQPEQTMRENMGELDEPFFMVLSAHIQAAQREKQEGAAQKLTEIGNIAIRLLQNQGDKPEVVSTTGSVR